MKTYTKPMLFKEIFPFFPISFNILFMGYTTQKKVVLGQDQKFLIRIINHGYANNNVIVFWAVL